MIPQASRDSSMSVVLASVASGILYYFGTGLHAFGPLVIAAPVPILLLAFRSSLRTTIISAFMIYTFGGLNMAGYLARLMPPGIVFASIVIPALAFVLAIVAARAAVLNIRSWTACFVFPAIWTSYEFLLSLVSPHGTAGSIAYSQVETLPIIQIASITGLWGITFIITLLPAGFAIAWHFQEERNKAMPPFAISLALFAVVLAFGFIQILQSPKEWPIPVGLAAADTSIRYFETTKPEEAIPVIQQYARRSSSLAMEGARVVVLPEKFVGVTPLVDTTLYRIFAETAHENRVFIVAGLNYLEPLHKANTAIVFSPLEYSTMLEYDKKYLIPGFESEYRPGTKPVVFQIRNIKAGIQICKDMDFPQWSREYGKLGARVLLVPAWDFKEDARLHSQMAILRGIENGFAVVRCAQEGLLTVSDDKGRILAEESSATSPEALLLSVIVPGPGKTAYVLFGDWFAWLNLGFVGLFVPTMIVWSSTKALARFQSHS